MQVVKGGGGCHAHATPFLRHCGLSGTRRRAPFAPSEDSTRRSSRQALPADGATAGAVYKTKVRSIKTLWLDFWHQARYIRPARQPAKDAGNEALCKCSVRRGSSFASPPFCPHAPLHFQALTRGSVERQGMMMSERPASIATGMVDSSISIGNYKGVMLCNRPFAGASQGAAAAAAG